MDNSTRTADVPLIFDLYSRILASKQERVQAFSCSYLISRRLWMVTMHTASKLAAKQPAAAPPPCACRPPEHFVSNSFVRPINQNCLLKPLAAQLLSSTLAPQRMPMGLHSVENDTSGWAVPLWHDSVYPLWVHQSLGVWPNPS